MNILVTTRCNFACRHCMHSCTKEGSDMPFSTFKKAVKQSEICLQIFGGEPTLHPDIIHMVKYALRNKALQMVTLTTNGSKLFSKGTITKLGKSLADIKKNKRYTDRFKIRISFSKYHKRIIPDYWFLADRKNNYVFETLNVSDRDIKQLGRAKNLPEAIPDKCNSDIHNWFFGPPQVSVFPNGEVSQCSAGKMIFTNVNTDPNIWESYGKLAERKNNCATCPKYNFRYKNNG